jgi:hypothetical protein
MGPSAAHVAIGLLTAPILPFPVTGQWVSSSPAGDIAPTPFRDADKGCTLIGELSVGHAEVLFLLAAFMASAVGHCENQPTLFCGCQSAFAIFVRRVASRAH